MTPRIYLDHNATTRPLPAVVDAVDRCWRAAWANPGSRHAEGRAARRALEDARETVARILNADPDEVIFTSGGTESINLAILGLASRASVADAASVGRGDARPVVALTAGEHPATTETVRRLESRGWRRHILDVDADGKLRPEAFQAPPEADLRLATVILAHNETGVVQDVSRLAAACRERGVPLHLDAVQAVGKIPVDFHALDVAALSLAAHKFHGPRGVGALLLRNGVALAPQLVGGHQESERRAGTEPVALAVGLATALALWHDDAQRRAIHLASLRDELERRLQANCAPTVVHGTNARRLPNTLSIAFPGVDGEALLVSLDLAGVASSLGSTCASGSAEPAPALLAMGVPRDVALASVRFSVGLENTREEVEHAAERIAHAVRTLRERRSEG